MQVGYARNLAGHRLAPAVNSGDPYGRLCESVLRVARLGCVTALDYKGDGIANLPC